MVSVWKLVIFKKLQRSPLITVSYNRILRVVPGTVLLMQSILLGQRKVMQIRQRETLSHQRAIIHEVCLSSAQYTVYLYFPMK